MEYRKDRLNLKLLQQLFHNGNAMTFDSLNHYYYSLFQTYGSISNKQRRLSIGFRVKV